MRNLIVSKLLLVTSIVLIASPTSVQAGPHASLKTGIDPNNLAAKVLYPIDRGGSVMDYLLRNDTPKMIEGTCMSSCTLKLGASKICVVAGTPVSPKTVLWFHAPRGDYADTHGRYLMMLAYSRFPRVAAWAKSKKVLSTKSFKSDNTLTGWQLVKLGVPKCT